MSVKILQICKATTKFQDFIKSPTILLERITKQESLKNHMETALLKPFNSHKNVFFKLRKTKDYILNLL